MILTLLEIVFAIALGMAALLLFAFFMARGLDWLMKGKRK